jgi:hypothetical protein
MAASVLSSARCLSGASNTFGLSSNNAGAGAGQTVRRYSVVQVNAIAEKTSADTEVPQDVLACKLYCMNRSQDLRLVILRIVFSSFIFVASQRLVIVFFPAHAVSFLVLITDQKSSCCR